MEKTIKLTSWEHVEGKIVGEWTPTKLVFAPNSNPIVAPLYTTNIKISENMKYFMF